MDKGGSADVDKREEAGGSANVNNFILFCNIIINCQNVDKH